MPETPPDPEIELSAEDIAEATALGLDLGLEPGQQDLAGPGPWMDVAMANFLTPREAGIVLLATLAVWTAIGIGPYFAIGTWVVGPSGTLAIIRAEIAAGGVLWGNTVYYGLTAEQAAIVAALEGGIMGTQGGTFLWAWTAAGWSAGTAASIGGITGPGALWAGSGGGAGVVALMALYSWTSGGTGNVGTYNERYFDHNYGIVSDAGGWWYYDADALGGGQWRYYKKPITNPE